ncbi:HNH endonuclease [Priestia sp. J2]|uniref:HNH endonuclease n=1 Tax=Priestia sp. J2 TaxID=2886505 RepID=UPI001E572B62|nr:HNH endonuclease [Priestia sp. J2]
MAKEWAKPFYSSSAWKKCRKAYIDSVFNLCERCGESKERMIVHHKTYLTKRNINNLNITLNHELLELLCQDCHNREHHGEDKGMREGFGFDANGNLIKVD